MLSKKTGAIAVTLAALVLAGCGIDRDLVPIPEGLPPGPGAPLPVIDIDAPGRTAVQLNGWAAELSDTLRIPVPALEAYGYAAAVMVRARPDCGIAWTTLAGIGSVESKHGTYRGSEVSETGRVDPPIIGIALDGSPGVARIPDTDNGALDGDPVHDRAVGPLQFIPETWKRWGVDANGDGVIDPHSIDDAALTAARYLCDSGGVLTSAEGWSKALFTYNRSERYMMDVRDRAAAYSVGRRV
ncbi:lytic transglycosylase domain-containing protein [Nocardia cyriacigeorgica]|uniref:Lytic murein transglycosylase n=1 Tax=Nocardia cyriacigeorgica TaxID=135487 RepID=A0A4U8WCS7_9NOCA|nr:lytic murein transglycosylase [Nocardia cyriacigeorgica]MBF6341964.1 lytic murein transglycosylase [Nocardia cyriacigeorgica]MBF6513077.1 lytic murein transglycosylase [Nocardia cyriacigeorgica]VFA99618.1 lytic murein transglycosylase [Nocardia cyriacigeorgica]